MPSARACGSIVEYGNMKRITLLLLLFVIVLSGQPTEEPAPKLALEGRQALNYSRAGIED